MVIEIKTTQAKQETKVTDRKLEVYLGNESDRRYMKEYLRSIREIDPIEIATVSNPTKLSDIPKNTELIDIGLFNKLVDSSINDLKKRYGIEIEKIDLERCYVAEPEDETIIGGFHDLKSLGYQYWYEASFTMIFNSKLVSKEIRTLELVRNYLHDCLHHSTFRSFKRAFRMPAETNKAKHRVPEIYREQYGINLRNQDGLSYSAPDLTKLSPQAINLNLLMDGVIIIVTSEVAKRLGSEITPKNEIEQELLNEILLAPFNNEILQRHFKFYKNVTEPTQKFIAHWGGDELIKLVLQAMYTGDLKKIKKFFDDKTGKSNSWEGMFMQSDFKLSNQSINTKEIKSKEEITLGEILENIQIEGFVKGTEQYEICKRAIGFWDFAYKRDEELVDAKTVDCSTLTSQSHWEGALINIPFIAENQRTAFSGETIDGFDKMIPGDVLIKFVSIIKKDQSSHLHLEVEITDDSLKQNILNRLEISGHIFTNHLYLTKIGLLGLPIKI